MLEFRTCNFPTRWVGTDSSACGGKSYLGEERAGGAGGGERTGLLETRPFCFAELQTLGVCECQHLWKPRLSCGRVRSPGISPASVYLLWGMLPGSDAFVSVRDWRSELRLRWAALSLLKVSTSQYQQHNTMWERNQEFLLMLQQCSHTRVQRPLSCLWLVRWRMAGSNFVIFTNQKCTIVKEGEEQN